MEGFVAISLADVIPSRRPVNGHSIALLVSSCAKQPGAMRGAEDNGCPSTLELKMVRTPGLKSGKTKTCGCLNCYIQRFLTNLSLNKPKLDFICKIEGAEFV